MDDESLKAATSLAREHGFDVRVCSTYHLISGNKVIITTRDPNGILQYLEEHK